MSSQQKHQQQLRHYIERPPYYHLPRSRPVTFEQPCYDRETTTSSYYYQSADSSGTQNATSEHATFNNSPKPFSQGPASTVRRWGNNDCGTTTVRYAQDDNSSVDPPRILLNNQSYPTSTVHKSMLQSKRPTQHATGGGQASLDRLVRPTIMTASYESLSPQTVNFNTSCSGDTSFSPNQTEIDSQQQASYIAEAVIHAAQSKDQRDRQSASSREATRQDGSSWNYSSANHAASEAGSTDCHQTGNTLRLFGQTKPKRNPMQTSNTVLPDTKKEEYMWNKQLEQKSIAHQTYRTLPIVLPKPKARHDLASGTYMRYNQDPTWDLYTCSRPSSASSIEHERKIQQAVTNTVASYPLAQSGLRHQEDSPAMAFNYREYIQGVQRPPVS